MTDFARLLEVLSAAKVEFILIGGAAATAHGSARLTLDLDVAYSRSSGNLDRLAPALAPLEPYPRDVHHGLPFRLDTRTLRHGLNFMLTTTLGELDLFGEIVGGGGFEDLVQHTIPLTLLASTACVWTSTN